MQSQYIKPNSGTSKILNYLKGVKRGSLLTIDDFRLVEGISYTNIRSILVYLCDLKVLLRVGFGIYCYPKIVNKKMVFPSAISVVEKMSDRDNWLTAQEAIDYGFMDEIIKKKK